MSEGSFCRDIVHILMPFYLRMDTRLTDKISRFFAL